MAQEAYTLEEIKKMNILPAGATYPDGVRYYLQEIDDVETVENQIQELQDQGLVAGKIHVKEMQLRQVHPDAMEEWDFSIKEMLVVLTEEKHGKKFVTGEDSRGRWV